MWSSETLERRSAEARASVARREDRRRERAAADRKEAARRLGFRPSFRRHNRMYYARRVNPQDRMVALWLLDRWSAKHGGPVFCQVAYDETMRVAPKVLASASAKAARFA